VGDGVTRYDTHALIGLDSCSTYHPIATTHYLPVIFPILTHNPNTTDTTTINSVDTALQ